MAAILLADDPLFLIKRTLPADFELLVINLFLERLFEFVGDVSKREWEEDQAKIAASIAEDAAQAFLFLLSFYNLIIILTFQKLVMLSWATSTDLGRSSTTTNDTLSGLDVRTTSCDRRSSYPL